MNRAWQRMVVRGLSVLLVLLIGVAAVWFNMTHYLAEEVRLFVLGGLLALSVIVLGLGFLIAERPTPR